MTLVAGNKAGRLEAKVVDGCQNAWEAHMAAAAGGGLLGRSWMMIPVCTTGTQKHRLPPPQALLEPHGAQQQSGCGGRSYQPGDKHCEFRGRSWVVSAAHAVPQDSSCLACSTATTRLYLGDGNDRNSQKDSSCPVLACADDGVGGIRLGLNRELHYSLCPTAPHMTGRVSEESPKPG